MKRIAPPSLLHSFLLFLLPPRDRETVSGDLHEEFLEVKLPELGAFKARFWYLQQVVSFVPGKIAAVLLQGPSLAILCFFTALSGGWLGVMDILLRHPGYKGRVWIAATIVGQALLTLGVLRFRRLAALRIVALGGTLPLLWLAGTALNATLRGAHLEGYILLIALALIVQAILTLFTLLRSREAKKSA